MIQGLNEFVTLYASADVMGPGGILEERGLVVLPPETLATVQDAMSNAVPMVAPAK